ncbi:M28 family peptidase [Pseudocnuella soli]|uniref:M28 family peptidase n=1 Tax=Pseudocnuella soli TaxID=2502779 RepID=UPI0010536DE2|nr:M28 family peptidase [Pseudocnuella soli]
MKRIFLPVLLCGSLVALAQKPAKPENYAKTITAADLKKHLYIVAGPEMEGRETATEGQRKAAAYIENEFRRIGLEPGNNGSFQQMYPLFQDSLAGASLEVDGQAFQLFNDFSISPASSLAGTFRLGEVVAIAKSNADGIATADLAGKMVLVFADAANQQTMQAIRAKGPAAVMILSPNYKAPAQPTRKGRMVVQQFAKSLPLQQITVSEAVAKAILKDNFEAAKTATGTPKAFPAQVALTVDKTTIKHESSNVLGVLPGADKADEYLVITAHYDHEGKREGGVIYYGADDDGSGTVSVIELAEAFAKAKKEGRGPRRSILFMTVSGEERGLLGSEYYSMHPTYPLAKTTANLNIDMIGRIDPKRTVGDSTNYVYVVGDDKLSSDLRPISEAVNKKFIKMELDYKYNDPDDKEFIYYRSDHYNFAKNGVPIIFYFNGTHADYHKPTDTPDKINYNLMEKRARLVFHTAWEMANRNDMLKRDRELPALRR